MSLSTSSTINNRLLCCFSQLVGRSRLFRASCVQTRHVFRRHFSLRSTSASPFCYPSASAYRSHFIPPSVKPIVQISPLESAQSLKIQPSGYRRAALLHTTTIGEFRRTPPTPTISSTKPQSSSDLFNMTVKERYGAPFEEQDPREVNQLINAMLTSSQKGKNKGGFSCRKNDFSVEGSKLSVRSWKFNDWDYKKTVLPTNARGLFTCKLPGGDQEIVIRGYDKFFNINETSRTRWDHIEENTQGPYEVTLKENGCIIFISGLPDGTLLVCSKHSTGARADVELSHAMAGDKWINQQLEKVGKTRQQFAKFLRNANITAVAELCDDSFEEHILAYTGDDAGLYLHGVNLNLPTFATWSASQVHAFADDWGFKKIETFEKSSVGELKEFLEGVAESGEWNGRAVEGFVIRCKARYGPEDSHWHDWFFKYKFEEPYLMYRQWREVTKKLIAGKPPTFKKHVKITEEYLRYARDQLRQNPALGKAFNNNHGIIAMRDGFLASKGVSGHDIVKAEENEGDNKAKSLVLAPIATLGCGKTTVALALVKLFGFGHVQNDNITVQRGKPLAFANEVVRQLNDSPVCIADRNNHQKREREQLFNDVRKLDPEAHFVALNYVHYRTNDPESMTKIREITQKRIFDRGDNHQTIHSGTGDKSAIIGIMDGFLSRFQALDAETEPDDQFDLVIDLDPLAESRDNLETVISKLYEHYPYMLGEEMPSADDLDEATKYALSDYTPKIKHIIGKGGGSSKGKQPQRANPVAHPEAGKSKQPAVEYYAVKVPTAKINVALDQAFSSKPPEFRQFYTTLKNSRRIQGEFHITMAHRANYKKQADLWNHYTQLHQSLKPGKTEIDDLQVRLEKVVWDNRVMAIVADLVDSKGHESGNACMHITVGTADTTIKPFESNALLEKWHENQENLEAAGLMELPLGKNGAGVEIEGYLRAVLGRR